MSSYGTIFTELFLVSVASWRGTELRYTPSLQHNLNFVFPGFQRFKFSHSPHSGRARGRTGQLYLCVNEVFRQLILELYRWDEWPLSALLLASSLSLSDASGSSSTTKRVRMLVWCSVKEISIFIIQNNHGLLCSQYWYSQWRVHSWRLLGSYKQLIFLTTFSEEFEMAQALTRIRKNVNSTQN